jgi:hypothetical protein
MEISADLTASEAAAFASVVRGLRPPDEIAAAWFAALDKISPQLPPASEVPVLLERIFARVRSVPENPNEGFVSEDREISPRA